MNKIIIEVIPHEKQRYETSGDYFYDENGDLQIKVSKLGNTPLSLLYERLIAIHELAEVIMTEYRGIKEEDISAFDIKFEKEREQGLHGEDDEPGDAPDAPYRLEHQTSDIIERMILATLGLSYKDYEDYHYKTLYPNG